MSVRGSIVVAVELLLVGLVAPPPARYGVNQPVGAEAAAAHLAPLELVQQCAGRLGDVRFDAHVDSVQHPERSAVGVDLHDAGVWREEPSLVRRPVVERSAEREHEVGFAESFEGERRGEATGDPD